MASTCEAMQHQRYCPASMVLHCGDKRDTIALDRIELSEAVQGLFSDLIVGRYSPHATNLEQLMMYKIY